MSLYFWQRNLDGWKLSHKERIEFIRKVVKVGNYYKKCAKIGCTEPVVNKKNRHYCAEHQREIWKQIIPFTTPDLLEILLEINEES